MDKRTTLSRDRRSGVIRFKDLLIDGVVKSILSRGTLDAEK